MTRDEAKRLLGGYATGSLTDQERQALFDAALDDQELFDELAGEEDLKEILALPGAKQRLTAALSPVAMASEGSMTTNAPEEKKKRAWWLFALAGVAGVSLIVWVATKKTDTPVEVATSQAPQSAEVADSKSSNAPLTEPSNLSPALDKLARSDHETASKTTIEGEKAAPAKSARAVKSAGIKGAIAGTSSKNAAAPQPGPTPPQAKPQAANGFLPGAGAGPGAADATQPRAEAQLRSAPPTRPDAPPVRAGQLTYVLTGRGSLKVTPAVSGSLEVTAGDRHVIGWDPVVANSTVEMPVPSGVDSLTLRFATPGQREAVVQIPIRQ